MAGVLHLAVRHNEVPKAMVYLGAMLACVFVVDLFAGWFPTVMEFPVRRPGREAAFVVGIELLALVLAVVLFVLFPINKLPVAWKIASLPAMAIIFPIALPLVLLLWKYKPRELGLRFNSMCWVFLPVLLITAGAAYLADPDDFTVGTLLASEGVLGALVTGFITAGLSEEFVRMALQTRVGAYLRNPPLAWLFATLVWAFLHSPNWYAKGGDLYEALMGAVRIIPLGLMWGYITHRTKSLLPATLVHGMNVWGLQNF
ncbi:MAG: CPBP family intramembrane metalloprotease [Flavobacteriales bacterium]|nr:CPBP family intramembrane metalloprotease [Flavobacteriales bacterium]MBK9700144.1 CPBP family intramembrane metalloprotease [Flavobacteriales bacterium]